MKRPTNIQSALMAHLFAGSLLFISAVSSLAAAQPPDGIAMMTGPGAEMESASGELDVFQCGAQLFLDRPYPIKEVPPAMEGFKFIRDKIDRVSVVCRKAGVVFVLTPKAGRSPDSREAELSELGFQKVDMPDVPLFEGGWNRCSVYQKEMAVDEPLNLKKWGVVVVPDHDVPATKQKPSSAR